MKTRIKMVELNDGTVKYYPQFKGWFFWYYFEETCSAKFDTFRETLADKKLQYGSSERHSFDFAIAVLDKHKELEAKYAKQKQDKKVKQTTYMYFAEESK
jgi:hypothetical protein